MKIDYSRLINYSKLMEEIMAENKLSKEQLVKEEFGDIEIISEYIDSYLIDLINASSLLDSLCEIITQATNDSCGSIKLYDDVSDVKIKLEDNHSSKVLFSICLAVKSILDKSICSIEMLFKKKSYKKIIK